MSSGHVVPHPEVCTNDCQSDSINITTGDNWGRRPPPTEAYRSQQFSDITDDLEGLPRYQDGMANYFIIAQDVHHPLSRDPAKTFELSDRFLYVQTGHCIDTEDFILFQGEALDSDNLRDADSSNTSDTSDTSSCEISCYSGFSLYNSSEASAPTASPPKFAEDPGLISGEFPLSGSIEPCDRLEEINLSRLLHWLKSIPASSNIVASCIGSNRETSIISAHRNTEDNANPHSGSL